MSMFPVPVSGVISRIFYGHSKCCVIIFAMNIIICVIGYIIIYNGILRNYICTDNDNTLS